MLKNEDPRRRKKSTREERMQRSPNFGEKSVDMSASMMKPESDVDGDSQLKSIRSHTKETPRTPRSNRTPR